MARFAKRVLSIEPSPTVRISDLIAESQGQGKKILSLAIGEPDFPTPGHIIEAAKKALDDGYTKYTAALRNPRAARGDCGEVAEGEWDSREARERDRRADEAHALHDVHGPPRLRGRSAHPGSRLGLLRPDGDSRGCEARADPRGRRGRIRPVDGDGRRGDHPADPVD